MSGVFNFERLPGDKTPNTPETHLQVSLPQSIGGFGGFAGGADCENESQPFPLEMLPDTVRNMALEIAEVALVPESLAAVNLLGLLSSSLGGGLLIDSGGGRITPGNLFILGIAESGTGKGRAFFIVSKPFREIEAEEVSHWETEVLPGIKRDLRLIEKDFRTLEKAIEKGGDSLNREQIGRELQDLERRKAELEKQLASEAGFSVADITKEKLAITLEQQPGQALASLSPEGRGVVDVLMGKYGKGSESDEDLYCSAYCRESVKVSRVSRPPVTLSNPCLAVLWLIQPDKARRLTESEAITESGLLPRFLICDSKAEAMDEPEEPRAMNQSTVQDWAELIRHLLEEFRAKGETPVTIQAEKEARRHIIAFQNASSARRRKGGDLHDIAPFVSRWAENAWRLALVLHAGKHGRDAGKIDLEADTARRAVEIVKWFSREQLAILAPERSSRNRKRLLRLISILSDHHGQRTLRDLTKSHGFTKEEVQKLAEQFPAQIKLGVKQPEGGGRPSELVKLKPTCLPSAKTN
jgi:hypothetical protein